MGRKITISTIDLKFRELSDFLTVTKILNDGARTRFQVSRNLGSNTCLCFLPGPPGSVQILTEAAQIVTSPNDVLKRMQLLRLDYTFLWSTHNYLLVRSLQNRVQTTWEGNDVLRCRKGGDIKKNSICFASLFYFLFVCFIRHVIY